MANRQQPLTFTCALHGPFQAWTVRGEIPECWCGCSSCFVEPWKGQEIPSSSLPCLPPPPPPSPPVPRAAKPAEQTPDEVRAALRELLAQAPPGSKRAIALGVGFRGRWALHSARSISHGRGWLFPAVQRRISRRVQQLERGELTLVATGARGPGKRLFRVVQAAPK